MVTPAQKRQAVQMMQAQDISLRRACKEIGVSRSSIYYSSQQAPKDQKLMEMVKEMSAQYPRFGYRRIAAMLNNKEDLKINSKRVYRIWSMYNAPKSLDNHFSFGLSDSIQ